MSDPIRSGVSQHRYGLRPSPANHPLVVNAMEEQRFLEGLETAPLPPPPSEFLSGWFPGIRNQGQEGACTGFATAGFREVLWGTENKATIGFRLAPAYLYARARMAEGSFPADNGATMADEFACLQAYGVCPEVDLPYDQDPKEAPTAVADGAAVEFRIKQPLMVKADPLAIKSVLASDYPIGIAIPVYQSFENVGADGKLTLPDTKKEAFLGGHGVLLVGYNEWGMMGVNQWGTGWGQNGFMYFPWGYEKLYWELWTVEPDGEGT
jgi:hypothetical protein